MNNDEMMIRTFSRGEVIFRQGEPADCMFDIRKGSVGIYSDYATELQKQLTTVDVNGVFGEMGLLEGKPRSATAVALEADTQLLVISEDTFAEYFRKQPVKVVRIMQGMSKRIRNLTQEYMEACSAITEYADSAEQEDSAPIRQRFRRYVQYYDEVQATIAKNPELYYDGHMYPWNNL